jgi:predicted enzyme related to lactoylglutathione lyase
MGDEEPYTMINNGDQAIGGYRKGPPGVRSHWVSYLSVQDVDSSHSAAVAAGCRVMMTPTNYGTVGRAAAIADPLGASFCVWKGANGDPPDVEKTPMGGWFWNELWTSNDRVALSFYETMFGFTHDAMEMGPTTYYVLKADGRPRAGLCQSVNPEARSMWLPYVAVPNCDEAAKKAAALGGEVVTQPRDIPGIGRFGIVVDASGAAVAFITPAGA